MSDSTSRPTYSPMDKSQFDGNNFFHSGAIKVTKKYLGIVLNTQTNSFNDQTSNKLRQAAIEIGFHEQGIHIKPHEFFQSVYVLCVNLTAKKLEDAHSEAFYALERITQELVKINTPVFNLAVEVQSFPPVIANRQSAFRPIDASNNSYVAATVASVASVVTPVAPVDATVAVSVPVAPVTVAPVTVATPVAATVVTPVESISTANTETASESVETSASASVSVSEPEVQQTTTSRLVVRSRPVSPLLPTIKEEETVVALDDSYLDASAYAPDESDIIGTKLFNMWKEHNEVFEARKAVRDEAFNKLKALEKEYFELETECGVEYTKCIRLWEAFQASKFYN